MYRHIYGVAVLILYFYHLLITVALRHSYQSAETSYAVVYMHYVVTRFKLAYLFERKSHFSASCPVGAKVVFMEAIEYLMVCEEAYPQVVVGKALMQCLVNGCKFYRIAVSCTIFSAAEYLFETFVLLAAVGKNE